MWHKMVPGLSEQFRVIVFDNRGVGNTDKPEGPYAAQMLADDTAGLLEALDIEQAAVMGHSMGGFVAQALVLSRPALVSKLILSATNFGGPNHIPITPEAMAVLSDMESDPLERLRRGIVVSCAPGFAKEQPEVIEEWVSYRATHPLVLAAYQAQFAIGLALASEEAAFEHKLNDVQVPTLILFGEHDKVVPPGNAELLAREIPNRTLHILPDAGHFFPFEVPDEAVAVITDFLKD
jgi:pimeloyl-ACP methyl ester carboxylesterase